MTINIVSTLYQGDEICQAHYHHLQNIKLLNEFSMVEHAVVGAS